jgi:hypothetical protein
MYPLTGPNRYEIAGSYFHPAPNRWRSIADGQRNNEHAWRYCNKGDPWQTLIAGREVQMVQHYLCQPCAKAAVSRDQQVEDTVVAQSRLKIVRFTKS